MNDSRPIKLLIAALGGEGGAVLTNWVVSAAEALDFPVQSTSIPGVAQRTGATTYYIEILPVPASELGGRKPVMALVPGVGDVDIVVTSELLEAGRAIGSGFCTPDRTLLVASTHRIYAMAEKIAMGDGRVDTGKLLQSIEEHSRETLLIDMDFIAQQTGAMINAVLLGALAGIDRLPIPVEGFEAAIQGDGKSVDANLRGFRAGLKAAQDARTLATEAETQRLSAAPPLAPVEQAIAILPEPAREIVAEGVRRLAAYQNHAYAQRYLERLNPIRAADIAAGANGRLLAETARHLALRMSFEDVIRVAEAKLDPARFTRIAKEVNAAPGEPFIVIDFFKPGIEELASVLPPFLARPILRVSERRGWLDHVYLGMKVNSTSVSGFLRLRLLASLKRFRPYSYRFLEEQKAIDAWLDLVARAAAISGDLALEIVDCARLIKGYGDTLKRGITNYGTIEARVIHPALAGQFPIPQAIDAIASARIAALSDPEGESLARSLTEIDAHARLRIAAE